MKRNGWIAAIFALGFIGVLSMRALAEETPAVPPAVEVEEPEYAFGTAKSVEGDTLVINEFDYDTGEEKEATYWVDSKTEYDNVASLKEVAAGDEVDIDYLVKDGKKVAVAISVAKPVEGEEGE
ncbi:MAG: hypothetical protein Q7J69_00990 [Candidatus Omnitrophota bacterium]|nr:hypothetical protein [Candidatus Omnitrophota bacterium]